jgi:predicted metal-binding membrane protein
VVQQTYSLRLDRIWSCLAALMQAAIHSAREAYRRLASTVGAIPLTLLFSLIAVTAIAWAFTLYQPFAMDASMGPAMGEMGGMVMEDMAMDGMSAGWSFLVFVTVWTTMMVAMMLPAAVPMILIFAAAQARRDRHVAVPTWIFVAGYVLVWATAGLGAYVLDQAFTDLLSSHRSTAGVSWAPIALGITLILAGLYQFTPLKHVCLRQCRSPWGFVAQYWREGRTGAVNMGVRHGLYCLGCCCALFAVLTAVGMMSVAWMVSLTLVVFAEKVFPFGVRISAAVGLALVALGLLIAAGALQLPSHA